MRKLIYFVLAAVIFVACGEDDFGYNSKREVVNPYAVTPEEAVQMLQSVIGGETTRSISVSDIQTLNKSAFVPSTRSGADEEAIYIVDIEGKGSAIMSADKRMEPIYAIFDKTKLSAEKLVGVTTRSVSNDGNPEDYILGLLNSAIQRDIQTMGQRALPELPIIPRDELWEEKTVYKYKAPMLNTEWDQDHPFNKLYECIPGSEIKYPAGCGPIALAQILYYNRFPSSINGVTFDWNLIARHEKGQINAPIVADNEVAKLVYQIKQWTGTYPIVRTDENGQPKYEMATDMPNVQVFMRLNGYSDATLGDYSLEEVIDMVYYKQLPVLVSGVDHYDHTKGHAWVIDGCNIYKIDVWCRHYNSDFTFTEYLFNSFDYEFVHCNFGWLDGEYNGEIHSGVFYTPIGYYDTQLKLVTYSLN